MKLKQLKRDSAVKRAVDKIHLIAERDWNTLHFDLPKGRKTHCKRAMDLTQDNNLEAGLSRIRQRFLQRLDGQADEIFNLLEILGNPATDAETSASLHAIAHKLHGTAKTVGFAKLGEISAELELCISQAMSNSGAADVVAVRNRTEQLLDEIEATLLAG